VSWAADEFALVERLDWRTTTCRERAAEKFRDSSGVVKNALKSGAFAFPAGFTSCGRHTTILDQKNGPDFGKHSPAAPKFLSAMKYPG
jgi:hypothetical protein